MFAELFCLLLCFNLLCCCIAVWRAHQLHDAHLRYRSHSRYCALICCVVVIFALAHRSLAFLLVASQVGALISSSSARTTSFSGRWRSTRALSTRRLCRSTHAKLARVALLLDRNCEHCESNIESPRRCRLSIVHVTMGLAALTLTLFHCGLRRNV